MRDAKYVIFLKKIIILIQAFCNQRRQTSETEAQENIESRRIEKGGLGKWNKRPIIDHEHHIPPISLFFSIFSIKKFPNQYKIEGDIAAPAMRVLKC